MQLLTQFVYRRAKNSYGLDVFLLHGAVKNVMDSDRFSSIIVSFSNSIDSYLKHLP